MTETSCFLYLINKTGTAELLSLRNNKKVIVNMHCSLYCCIHSLCKPQSPIHRNGILHGKIYIVMILPKTTCCKPFHSFLHIENITHSSKKNHSIFNMQKFEKWNVMSVHCKPLCKISVNASAPQGLCQPWQWQHQNQKIRFHWLSSNAASMEKPEQCNYISALKNQYNQNTKSDLG